MAVLNFFNNPGLTSLTITMASFLPWLFISFFPVFHVSLLQIAPFSFSTFLYFLTNRYTERKSVTRRVQKLPAYTFTEYLCALLSYKPHMPLENYSLLTEANISKATCYRGTKGPPYLYIIVLSFTGQPQEKNMTPIEEIKYLDM